MNKKATKEKSAAAAVNARGQDVNWFLPYWNQQRKEHGARLPYLIFLTQKQVTMLKSRQAIYGTEIMRQFVLNLMTSDYVNGRRGKPAPSHLDYYLDKDRFPLVAQGKYNDLPVEERPMTEVERRQQEAERYRQQQDARRAEVRRIDEEERERRERERDERAKNCVSYEEYQRMKAEGLITN